MLEPKTISVSEFKATCLRLFEEVRRTGQPVLVTRRGEPIALVGPPPIPGRRWLGALEGTAVFAGDATAPACAPGEWEGHTLRAWDGLAGSGEGDGGE